MLLPANKTLWIGRLLFFYEKACRLHDECLSKKRDDPVKSTFFESFNLSDLSELQPCSAAEALGSLLKLKSNSVDSNGFQGRFLKQMAYVLAPKISEISKIFVKNGLPTSLIFPFRLIPKGTKNPIYIEQQRPIGKTCALLRSTIKSSFSQIENHISEMGVSYPSQHGFSEGKSCITLLMSAIVFFHENPNKCLSLTKFDFSSAFSMVSGPILLEKLKRYGFCSCHCSSSRHERRKSSTDPRLHPCSISRLRSLYSQRSRKTAIRLDW